LQIIIINYFVVQIVDLRHVDWKSYGRSDRYYIKKYVDIEPQAGVFIVDLEWLCLGVDSDNFGRSRFDEDTEERVPKAVLSLFAELYSLSRDRNYPHLILCIRGDLVAYYKPEQVKAKFAHTLLDEEVRKEIDLDCPSYQDEAFLLYELFLKIQRCSAALGNEAEWRPAGFYPSNIIREVPLEILAKLPKRARILTGVHPRNRIPTLKYLRAIAAKMSSRVSEL
jgi:hypothetical protein